VWKVSGSPPVPVDELRAALAEVYASPLLPRCPLIALTPISESAPLRTLSNNLGLALGAALVDRTGTPNVDAQVATEKLAVALTAAHALRDANERWGTEYHTARAFADVNAYVAPLTLVAVAALGHLAYEEWNAFRSGPPPPGESFIAHHHLESLLAGAEALFGPDTPQPLMALARYMARGPDARASLNEADVVIWYQIVVWLFWVARASGQVRDHEHAAAAAVVQHALGWASSDGVPAAGSDPASWSMLMVSATDVAATATGRIRWVLLVAEGMPWRNVGDLLDRAYPEARQYRPPAGHERPNGALSDTVNAGYIYWYRAWERTDATLR
jgi:hypothetical protein